MIRFALSHCEQLTVLVCAAEHEHISGELRRQWIAQTFPLVDNIDVRVFRYSERDLPCTSVSSEQVSERWAKVFRQLLPTCSTVITSEPYGEFVASFMGIRHVPFDPERRLVPISATAIRAQPAAHLCFLPYPVKEYYTHKVVLLGTESSGKSTLAEKLARHYGGALVREAGRDLIANSNHFTFDDLYRVAVEHARRIEEAVMLNNPLILIDTDVHITLSYARFVFGKELLLEPAIYRANQASLYLYLDKDITFVQDGTRLDEAHRNLLDRSHRAVLSDCQVAYHEIGGSWGERFDQAVVRIDELIQGK